MYMRLERKRITRQQNMISQRFGTLISPAFKRLRERERKIEREPDRERESITWGLCFAFYGLSVT